MTEHWKTVCAFAVAGLVAGAGWFFMVNEGALAFKGAEFIGIPLFVLFFPGLLVGLLAGSNVHDPSLPVAAIANTLLYGFILRLVFRRLWKGSQRNETKE